LSFTGGGLSYLSFGWGSPGTFDVLTLTTTTGAAAYTAIGLGIPITTNDHSFLQFVQFSAAPTEAILSATFSNASDDFEAAAFTTTPSTLAAPGPVAGAGLPALFGLAGAWFVRRRKQKLAALTHH
jgi:MYXO-CTERM domain-containing protein